MQVTRSKDGLTLSQEKYALELLQKAGISANQFAHL
jgi:hypothetical protein